MSHLAFSRRALRIVATLAATAGMAACGFKGPLYMPPPTAHTAPRPAATAQGAPMARATAPVRVAPRVSVVPGLPYLPSSSR